ncbi:MAG TPA: hypothetical protein VK569_03095 [Bacteroidota bacterium]|nr:hypothetical protein [Bacteroidota bacterium]
MAAAFVAWSCAASQGQFESEHWNTKEKGPIPTYLSTQVEVLEARMLPDSGVFYLYHASDGADQIPDLAKKLRRLYALGIDISMAWYRPTSYGCTDPRSGVNNDTTYAEFLLVLLDKKNDSLQKYNFSRIARPGSIPCPYRVSIYYPQFDSENQ